jgi:hypothetical protein
MTTITTLLLQPSQAHAEGLIEIGPYAGLGSLAALAACVILEPERTDCYAVAFLADPVGQGITSTSITLRYNTSDLTFNAQKSGFLCQFSSNGDCPAAGGVSPGTFPLMLLPSSGFSPGQPLPGSLVTLTDVGGAVTLDYKLSSLLDITQDTNFFLFMFDFKNPQIIDLASSTVTYSASNPGSDLTQTSFVCDTQPPGLRCGSSQPITGVSLYLEPEPSGSCVIFGLGFLGFSRTLRKRLLELVS